MPAWSITLCVMLGVGLLAWIIQVALVQGIKKYRALFTENARVQMSELFLFLDAEQLWAANLAIAAVAAMVAGLVFQSLWVAGCCGALSFVLPRHMVVWLRRRRLREFDDQLPDALLALSGALSAGASLQVGLTQIVAESQAPLAQEFGLMLREQRFGVTMDESLANLYVRVPTEAANLVVSALRIAADTGGNLADTLERIARTIRARAHMEGRIRVMTAQGRLQARVVGALPLLLVVVLYRLEPEAMQKLWTTAVGWAVLTVVVLLELVGLWLIRKIVRIDA